MGEANRRKALNDPTYSMPKKLRDHSWKKRELRALARREVQITGGRDTVMVRVRGQNGVPSLAIVSGADFRKMTKAAGRALAAQRSKV